MKGTYTFWRSVASVDMLNVRGAEEGLVVVVWVQDARRVEDSVLWAK